MSDEQFQDFHPRKYKNIKIELRKLTKCRSLNRDKKKYKNSVKENQQPKKGGKSLRQHRNRE